MLTALSSGYDMVKVWRSPVLDTGAESYAPVRRFIEANGLVLVEQKTVQDDAAVTGEYEESYYLSPANRLLVDVASAEGITPTE